MSAPANFNGQTLKIDPVNVTMLLIDHQSGLFQTVKNMPMAELRADVTTLAKVATPAKIPVIATVLVSQGPSGLSVPEIHEVAPHAQYVAHKGEINVWDDPEFVTAVKAIGRKQLIIAGTITSVCMTFPSTAVIHDGHQVFVVVGVSGACSKMAREVTLVRVAQADVMSMDTAAVCSEIQCIWNRDGVVQSAEVYSVVSPHY